VGPGPTGYYLDVQTLPLRPEVWLGIGVFAAAIGFAALSSMSDGSGRRFFRFVSNALLGTSVCLFAGSYEMLQWRLPHLGATGVVAWAGTTGDGRFARGTTVGVQLDTGGTVALHASGRDELFRKGQRIEVHYQGWTNALESARFLSASGEIERQYNGYVWLVPYLLFGLGLFAIWSAIRVYRRDSARSD